MSALTIMPQARVRKRAQKLHAAECEMQHWKLNRVYKQEVP